MYVAIKIIYPKSPKKTSNYNQKSIKMLIIMNKMKSSHKSYINRLVSKYIKKTKYWPIRKVILFQVDFILHKPKIYLFWGFKYYKKVV